MKGQHVTVRLTISLEIWLVAGDIFDKGLVASQMQKAAVWAVVPLPIIKVDAIGLYKNDDLVASNCEICVALHGIIVELRQEGKSVFWIKEKHLWTTSSPPALDPLDGEEMLSRNKKKRCSRHGKNLKVEFIL